MAHARLIDKKCGRCGMRRATHEVFNYRNASHGQFCWPCSQTEVKRLEDEERAITAGTESNPFLRDAISEARSAALQDHETRLKKQRRASTVFVTP